MYPISEITTVDKLIEAYVEDYNKGNNDFLLFDLAHANENSHTRVLMSLLKYKNYCFLPSFLSSIGLPQYIDFNKNIEITDQKNAIPVEKSKKASGYIDLYLKYYDTKNNEIQVVIENKIYGANDTKRQLARYVATLEGETFDTFDDWCKIPKISSSIYVLYLTSDGTKEPDKNSLPEKIGGELGDRFIQINYQDNILPWLEEDVLPNIPYFKDGMMISGVRQYIAYLYSMRKETISSLVNDYVDKNLDGEDVKKYKDLLKIIKSIKNNKDKDSILQSLKRELNVKAESIFANDIDGIVGNWRIHFTPSFICLYKQSWADLDTRKYSIPSIYLCGDQTNKFLTGKHPNWRLQVDHLGNNYEKFKDKVIEGLNLGPVARFDISGFVNCDKPKPAPKKSRIEYYQSIIEDFGSIINTIDEVVGKAAEELKNNSKDFNLQVFLLEKLIEKWPIKSSEEKV